MTKDIIIKLFKKTYPNSEFPNKNNLKAGDIEVWDSLGHLNFLLSVEKHFKIKFSMNELIELNNIDQISKAIDNKN